MGQNGFFRRALVGGFNQGDVLEYIDGQQKQMETLRTENAKFYEEYKALHDKYEKDKREVTDAFEKLKAMSVAYKEKAAENSYLTREVDILKNRLAELQELGILSSEEAGLEGYDASAEGENSQQTASLNIDKTLEAIDEKSSEIPESVSREIGALLLEAKHTADNLIEKAREEVNDIKAEGIEYAKQNIGLVENTNAQLQLLKSRMEDVFSRFADNLDTMCRELGDVKASVKKQEEALPRPKLKADELVNILDESQAAFTILQSEIQDVINNLDMSELPEIDSDLEAELSVAEVSLDMQREPSGAFDLWGEKGKQE